MDPTIVTALITVGIPAFLAAVATPIVVAYIQARNKRQEADIETARRQTEKEQEWKRADLLEARAAERAAEVARRAEETAEALTKATINVRDMTTTLNAKVDEVHVLVNSSYTAALRAALEAVQAKLVVLFDSVAFKREHKMKVEPDVTADIEATKKKMEELSAAINERLRQDVLAKEVKAAELLLGKQQDTIISNKDRPLPVADNRTATATERTAKASERVADAAEKTADKATNPRK